jgi:hypothetical protein
MSAVLAGHLKWFKGDIVPFLTPALQHLKKYD